MLDREIGLFKDLLTISIGLSPDSLGKNTLFRYLSLRMRALGIKTVGEYFLHIKRSKEELQELIELVVVPETWFFRERNALRFLEKRIGENASVNKAHPIRILCVPCSTGEEPYSVVITLLEAGLVGSEFVVDAVDISKKSLIKAQSLSYGNNSFRDKDDELRDRYFENKEETGYVVMDKVHSLVNFYFANVVDPLFLKDFKPYDYIFCRNLLMYLTDDAQKRAFINLDRLLRPGGVLFLGEAEYDIIRPYPFTLLGLQKECAYCKRISFEDEKNDEVKNFDLKRTKETTVSVFSLAKNFSKSTASLPTPTANKEQSRNLLKSQSFPSEEPMLIKAKNLADSGKLKEAEKLGLDYLKEHKLDPNAYFLLGLLQQAAGNEKKAEELFQKVIYLNPHHYEALISLSLFSEKKGNKLQAELLRKRAEKVYLT